MKQPRYRISRCAVYSSSEWNWGTKVKNIDNTFRRGYGALPQRRATPWRFQGH